MGMSSLRWISAFAASFVLSLTAHAQRGPASVFTEVVEEQVFAQRIEALGTLTPRDEVALTLNVADRVTAIYFEDGERVERGKTLLSLAQREQAALVEAAEADLSEARLQLARLERLVEDNAISQSELDLARRNANTAEAQLRAVQSRQRDRVLVAPFNGRLGFRQVSVGTFISPGDVVAQLVDDEVMFLDFDVPSLFIRQLRPGTEVIARTGDLAGQTFTGEVQSIDNRIDPVTRAIRVRAALPNPDAELVSGMFMTVTLTASPRSAVAIPEEALQAVGPRVFAFVVQKDGDALVARRTEVNIGTRANGYVEVLSGLEPGVEIVTEGIIRVRDGALIKRADPGVLSPQIASGRSGGGSPAAAAGGQ